MRATRALSLAVALLAVPILAGCAQPAAEVATSAAGAAVGAGIDMTAATALLHTAGDNLSGIVQSGVEPVTFFLGHDGGEPTLGITADGTIFYAAATFDNPIGPTPSILPRTDILRSSDGGLTWEDVTPYLPGDIVRTHPDTGDPYVYVDVETGRVFDIDQRLGVTCHTVTFSDDLGESWSPVDGKACQSPPADHQTLVTGKARTLVPSPLYPKMVYYCNNQIASSTCARSVNGGLTFEMATPAYPGYEVGSASPDLGGVFDGLCGGLHGHLVAGDDGTLYLPKTHCDRPYVSISADDMTTWTRVMVADVPSDDDPSVAVDAAGNVYLAFLHAETFRVMLTSSTDQGATWSTPVDVTPLGITATNLPTLDAGDDGRLALAYVGTSFPGGHDLEAEEPHDDMTWDGYLALITDAASAQPQVLTTRLNPATDPIVRGPCGPGRCNNPGIVDFIDVEVDADGRAWVALVDNCIDACAASDGKAEDSVASEAFVATLATGPALRGALDAVLPAIHGSTGA